MPSEYAYFNAASGVVASPGRVQGGGSIPLEDASAFPASWPKPARLSVARAGRLRTILKATGKSGASILVDGAIDGYADADVAAGDLVLISWTAADAEAQWGAIDSIPQGPQGPPGTAATIAVGSTTTGAPGSAVSVTNAGSSSAAILNFAIPRGDKGEKGDTGDPGTPGAKGAKGDPGPGVPAGGTTGQVLAKASGTDYATAWTTPAGGGVSFPLTDGSSQSSGSADQWSFKDTSGAVAAAVDKDGNEGSYEITFALARGVDLTAGTGLVSSWASAPGKILDIQIKAEVNGSSGGFTLAVKKNGTAIASQAVAASSTSLTTIAAGSISSLPIAKGDVFSIDASSVGTGVQSVRVAIRHARRNR